MQGLPAFIDCPLMHLAKLSLVYKDFGRPQGLVKAIVFRG
jgi:hypothetical protein